MSLPGLAGFVGRRVSGYFASSGGDVWVLLLLIPDLRAACEVPVSLAAVTAELDVAELLYPDGSPDAVRDFLASTARIDAYVPCLGVVVTPAIAARLHRVYGLRAWLRRNEGGLDAAVYFAAARAVEPFYTFPETLLVAGDPELKAYALVEVNFPDTVELPAQSGRQAYVNGDPGYLASKAWPALVQWTDGGDRVLCSEYLLPNTAATCVSRPERSGIAASAAISGASLALLAGGVGLQVYTSNYLARPSGDGTVQDQLDACEREECAYEPTSYQETVSVVRRARIGAVGMLAVGGLGLVGGGVSVVIHDQGLGLRLGRSW